MTADNPDLVYGYIEGDGYTLQVSNEAGVRDLGVLHVGVDKAAPERYRCKAGHEWDDDLYHIRFYGGGIDSVLEADSGPLCALCYAGALREQFGGERVVTDVPERSPWSRGMMVVVRDEFDADGR